MSQGGPKNFYGGISGVILEFLRESRYNLGARYNFSASQRYTLLGIISENACQTKISLGGKMASKLGVLGPPCYGGYIGG